MRQLRAWDVRRMSVIWLRTKSAEYWLLVTGRMFAIAYLRPHEEDKCVFFGRTHIAEFMAVGESMIFFDKKKKSHIVTPLEIEVLGLGCIPLQKGVVHAKK